MRRVPTTALPYIITTLTTVPATSPAAPQLVTIIPTTAGPPATAAGSAAVVSVVPAVYATTGIPKVTITAEPMTYQPSAKSQAGFFDTLVNFFAGLFGGGKSSDNQNNPSKGDNEPAGDLPPGMKPVTQVTTHVPQGEMPHDITVTSPMTGDSFYTTESIKVTWAMPWNPSGTVYLTLVRHDGNQNTELGHTMVPNTGEYTWYQQDLAHDCGLPGNPGCFGPSLAEQGITDMINYTNAWNLPPTMDCTVEVSTDAIDPYPAFYGSSGMFKIKNSHAFFDTEVTGIRVLYQGSYPPQSFQDPYTFSVGYTNQQYDPKFDAMRETWRTLVKADLTGLYVNQKIKKGTLTLQLTRTDKGTGYGPTQNSQDNSQSAISQVWVLSGKWPGFKPAAQTPIGFTYQAPATGGSTEYVTFDPQSGLITIDLTEAINLWLSDNTPDADTIVLVGPDESASTTIGFFISDIQVISLTVER